MIEGIAVDDPDQQVDADEAGGRGQRLDMGEAREEFV